MLDTKKASGREARYILDADTEAEVTRVFDQARQLTKYIGLLPQKIDLSGARSMLDIACGPGEWAQHIAQQFPQSQVTGVDLSAMMISYATMRAQAMHLPNLQFQVMDARQPLHFPDNAFDMLHLRFITGFMSTTTWPQLIQECFRIVRPGGLVCSTEFDCMGVTTSPALTRYNRQLVQAMRETGQCFTPAGEQIGITPVQVRLLRSAGFVDYQQQPYVINYSSGMPAHDAWYDNYKTLMKLMQPFLIRAGVTTQEEVENLYTQALQEMQADDFCGSVFYQAVWGMKAA